MRAGPAAVCVGEVHHRRSSPTGHAFTNRVRFAWLDPDHPEELTRHHWAWSSNRPAPVRFRADDYGRPDRAPGGPGLGDQVRDDLAPVLGHRPEAEVRMLSQLRHLGWLFNPITVFLAWDTDPEGPAGAVLEVTNTPWKERHRYPVALEHRDGAYRARFAKQLHVSPFLDEDYDYVLAIDDRDDRLVVTLDVVGHDATEATDTGGASAPATVSTRLDVERTPADRAALTWTLRSVPLSTMRVSAGIHAQALRLWRKRVPFVAHPDKRTITEELRPTDPPTDTDQRHEAPR